MARVGLVVLGVASLAALGVAPRAQAEFCGDGAADTGFSVERLWPLDCAAGVPTDAPVYVDGSAAHGGAGAEGSTLEVSLVRLEGENATGSPLQGDLEVLADGSSALWRPREPLTPRTKYRVSATRIDALGHVRGDCTEHTFVTGDAPMAPIALQGELDVTSRVIEAPEQHCTYDACGERECVAGERIVGRHLISVYVPRITGGLPAAQGELFAKPYEVVVRFAEQPSEPGGQHVFASAREHIDANEHAMVELAVPQLPERFVGCAEVTISDNSGATLELAPVCVELAPPEAPDAAVVQYARSTQESGAELAVAESSAGCSVSKTRVGTTMWYCAVAVLLMLIARRRARPF